MTRRKSVQKENHERWLVSYADLVTLLFAFFVVMFASTQTDHSRAKKLSEAVKKAFAEGSTPKISTILGGTVDDRGRGNEQMRGPALKPKDAHSPMPMDLRDAAQLLRERLRSEVAAGAVDIRVEDRGVIIGLNSAVFFHPGDDTIFPGVYPSVAKVATVLNSVPNALRLEGHTDSLPISNTRFPSNWELSAARGISMLHLLNDRYNIDRGRLAVVAYADTFAQESNDTAEGREKNRRVDIVIVNEAGMRAEPSRRR